MISKWFSSASTKRFQHMWIAICHQHYTLTCILMYRCKHHHYHNLLHHYHNYRPRCFPSANPPARMLRVSERRSFHLTSRQVSTAAQQGEMYERSVSLPQSSSQHARWRRWLAPLNTWILLENSHSHSVVSWAFPGSLICSLSAHVSCERNLLCSLSHHSIIYTHEYRNNWFTCSLAVVCC